MFDPKCDVCQALPQPVVDRITYPRPRDERGWLALDRLRGLLLGTAIGDGLGGRARRGDALTDDPAGPGSLRTGGATQVTLFTLEGTIRMVARAAAKGIGPAWTCTR